MESFSEWEKQHVAYHRMAGFELFGSLVASILDEKDGYVRFMNIMQDKYLCQVFKEDNTRAFIAGMLEMLENEYDGDYRGSMKKLYDSVCDWVTDSPESSYEVETSIAYETFSKLLHNKEELFRNLGYHIHFGRIKKQNTSAVTIRKYDNDCEETA